MTLWGIFGHIMAQNPISFLLLKQECWFKVTQMHREKTKPNQTKKKTTTTKNWTNNTYLFDRLLWLIARNSVPKLIHIASMESIKSKTISLVWLFCCCGCFSFGFVKKLQAICILFQFVLFFCFKVDCF